MHSSDQVLDRSLLVAGLGWERFDESRTLYGWSGRVVVAAKPNRVKDY